MIQVQYRTYVRMCGIHGIMVGRFNAREGAGGDTDWSVFDNAANGNRGSGLSKDAALRLAADLELQYDVYGPRNRTTSGG